MKKFLFFIHCCTIYILTILLFSVDLTFSKKNYDVEVLLRNKRYLLFPNPLESETKVQVLFGLGLPMEGEVSTILGYVLKCNYNLPYNSSAITHPYIRYQRDAIRSEHNHVRPMSRWEFYRLLESALETLGSGKACLLRAICEAAQTSFDESNGLLGELLHVILTPSSTTEHSDVYEDREYYAAEFIGKFSEGGCHFSFPECFTDPLSYFTIF
ncbi:uncharacterized protein [Chelonus insularis]|uniref:uncharacterized protein n=1 Tax=Chelonus insularis TaxID=460826 RepID=UPI00158D89F2|nr:uncharacterized protein LOC118064569 [Chelonus insularis]